MYTPNAWVNVFTCVLRMSINRCTVRSFEICPLHQSLSGLYISHSHMDFQTIICGFSIRRSGESSGLLEMTKLTKQQYKLLTAQDDA